MRGDGSSPLHRSCPFARQGDSRYGWRMNMHVVELPDETDAWAKAKAEAEGFLTVSDYVAHLVQQQKDGDLLRAALEAAQSVPLDAFDDAFFLSLDRLAKETA